MNKIFLLGLVTFCFISCSKSCFLFGYIYSITNESHSIILPNTTQIFFYFYEFDEIKLIPAEVSPGGDYTLPPPINGSLYVSINFTTLGYYPVTFFIPVVSFSYCPYTDFYLSTFIPLNSLRIFLLTTNGSFSLQVNTPLNCVVNSTNTCSTNMSVYQYNSIAGSTGTVIDISSFSDQDYGQYLVTATGNASQALLQVYDSNGILSITYLFNATNNGTGDPVSYWNIASILVCPYNSTTITEINVISSQPLTYPLPNNECPGFASSGTTSGTLSGITSGTSSGTTSGTSSGTTSGTSSVKSSLSILFLHLLLSFILRI